jgi:hypothetical protein
MNKLGILGIAAAFLVVVSAQPAFSYPDDSVDITVSTDKPTYKDGDLLTIRGTGAHSYTVVAEIVAPNGETIQELKFIAKTDGDFYTSWIIPRGIEDGTYTIQVSDVIKNAQTTFMIGTVTIPPPTSASASKTFIPDWVKQVAEFWIADQIDDSGFVQVIEYLVQEEIITIPYAEALDAEAATGIPIWIKTSAQFWVNGDVSDDEFATALEWLINNGIIQV